MISKIYTQHRLSGVPVHLMNMLPGHLSRLQKAHLDPQRRTAYVLVQASSCPASSPRPLYNQDSLCSSNTLPKLIRPARTNSLHMKAGLVPAPTQELTHNTDKLIEDNSILDCLCMKLLPSHSRYKNPLTSERRTRPQCQG